MKQLYIRNMLFFKEYDLELYTKLNSIIKNEKRYIIKYYKNSYNIFDKMKNTYLYQISLEQYKKNIKKEDLTNSTYNSFLLLKKTIYNTVTPIFTKPFNSNNVYLSNILYIAKDIFDIQQALNNFDITKKRKLKNIPAFIFFGTLLGDHIPYIIQKTKAKNYMITEPDIEIFNLSLFFVDYKDICTKNNIILNIAQSKSTLIQKYYKLISDNKLDNYIVKYYSTSYHEKDLMSSFLLAMDQANSLKFDYYQYLEYIEKSIKNIKKYNLLTPKDIYSNILDKPIFILSPGPSLRKNILWIKNNRSKILVVSYSATLKILFEYNIIPDIIIIIDANYIINSQFPNNKKYLEKIYKNSIAILATDVNRNIFKKFKKKNMFLYESNVKLEYNGLVESPAFTVGDTTLHILLSLKFKNIYLLGTDLAFDKITGDAYDNVLVRNMQKVNNIKKIQLNIDDNNNIKIKSNFDSNIVQTSSLFYNILDNYNKIIQYHKRNYHFNIYNCSNGAYIENTIPLKIDEITLSNNSTDNKKDLYDFLNQQSQIGFSTITKKYINQEVKYIKNLIKIIKKFKTKEIKTINQFYKFTNELYDNLLSHNFYSQITTVLLISYMQTINIYINFYFNTRKIDQKDLNKINSRWSKQFINILKLYLSNIKQI